jgi:hypothetical protein
MLSGRAGYVLGPLRNVTEIIALLRKQATLESQILNCNGTAIASERELEATRRRFAAHPQALNAVLQTARALGRTPDRRGTIAHRLHPYSA